MIGLRLGTAFLIATAPISALAIPTFSFPENLPQDVRSFIERTIDCNHWKAGVYGNALEGGLKQKISAMRCDALGPDGKRLKAKYIGNVPVSVELKKWISLRP